MRKLLKSTKNISWSYFLTLSKKTLSCSPTFIAFVSFIFLRVVQASPLMERQHFLVEFFGFCGMKDEFLGKIFCLLCWLRGIFSLSLCLLFPLPDCIWKQQMSVDLMKSFGIMWCSLCFLQGSEGTVWHRERSANLQLTSLLRSWVWFYDP